METRTGRVSISRHNVGFNGEQRRNKHERKNTMKFCKTCGYDSVFCGCTSEDQANESASGSSIASLCSGAARKAPAIEADVQGTDLRSGLAEWLQEVEESIAVMFKSSKWSETQLMQYKEKRGVTRRIRSILDANSAST